MSNLQRRTNAAYGIARYLDRLGFKTTTRAVSNITAKFLKSKGLPHVWFNPRYKGLFTADIHNAELVQEHWEEFKEWLKTLDNYPQSQH